MKQAAVSVGRSARRHLPALIAGAVLVWSSPASALVAARADLGRDVRATYSTLLLRAKVICGTERIGNTLKTWSCQDGYVCAPNHACNPGPAMQREIDRKRDEEAQRQAEEKRKRDAEAARQAEQDRQRAAAARQAELARQLAVQHARTQNPFGPGSADCNSTITDKDTPRGVPVDCNTRGTVNGPGGPFQHPVNRPPAQQTYVPGPQIPGITLSVPDTSTGTASPPVAPPNAQPDTGINREPMMKYALSPADDAKTLDRLWPFLAHVCDRADQSHGILLKDGSTSPAVELPIAMNRRIENQKAGLTGLRDAPGASLDLPLRNAEYFMIGLLGRAGGLADLLNVAAAPTYDYAKDHPDTPTGVAVRILNALKSWQDGDRTAWNMQATGNPNSPGGGFIWAMAGYLAATDVHPGETTADACRRELSNVTRDKVSNVLQGLRQEMSGDPDGWAAYPTGP